MLDGILECLIEEQLGCEGTIQKGYPREIVEKVVRLIDQNEYKRQQAAPPLQVTPKAFGVGRRIPIAKASLVRIP